MNNGPASSSESLRNDAWFEWYWWPDWSAPSTLPDDIGGGGGVACWVKSSGVLWRFMRALRFLTRFSSISGWLSLRRRFWNQCDTFWAVTVTGPRLLPLGSVKLTATAIKHLCNWQRKNRSYLAAAFVTKYWRTPVTGLWTDNVSRCRTNFRAWICVPDPTPIAIARPDLKKMLTCARFK